MIYTISPTYQTGSGFKRFSSDELQEYFSREPSELHCAGLMLDSLFGNNFYQSTKNGLEKYKSSQSRVPLVTSVVKKFREFLQLM